MRNLKWPALLGFIIAGILSPPASAQIPITSVNAGAPAGGVPEELAVNGSTNRAVAYNPVARTFSLYNLVVPTTVTLGGTRFINTPSLFPDLTDPMTVLVGHHLYLTNRFIPDIYVFDLPPADDATPTVTPLAILAAPGGSMNAGELAVDPVNNRVYVVDGGNSRVLVINDGTVPAFHPASPVVGGGLSFPSGIAFHFAAGKAYVANSDASLTRFFTGPPGGALGSGLVNIPLSGVGGGAGPLVVDPNVAGGAEPHVAVYRPGGPAIDIVDGTGDTFSGISVDLSASGFSNLTPVRMLLDPTQDRVLIPMNDSAFNPVVVHVDISHDPAAPVSGTPAILGATGLGANVNVDTSDGDFAVIAPSVNRMILRVGDRDRIKVINTATVKSPPAAITTAVVATEPTREEIVNLEPFGGALLATLADSGALRVMSAADGSLGGNVASAGVLAGARVDEANNRVWVAQTGASSTAVYDGFTLARTETGAGPFLKGPVVDPTTGATMLFRDLEASPATPAFAAFFVRPDGTSVTMPLTTLDVETLGPVTVDRAGHRLFWLLRPDKVRVIDFDPASPGFGTVTAERTIPLPPGGILETIAVNPATGFVYLLNVPASGTSRLLGFDATGAAAFAPVDLGGMVDSELVVHPGLNRVYLNDTTAGNINVHDGATGALIGTASLPAPPAKPTLPGEASAKPAVTPTGRSFAPGAASVQAFAPLLATDTLYLLTPAVLGNAYELRAMNMAGASFSLTLVGSFPGLEPKNGSDAERTNFVASSRNRRVYFCDMAANRLNILDADPASPTFHAIVASPTAGIGPWGVAVNEKTGRVYVVGEGGRLDVYGPGIAAIAISPVNLLPDAAHPGARRVPMLPFRVSVGGLEDARLPKADFNGLGIGNEPTAVSAVQLLEDTDADGFGDVDRTGGAPATFTADDGLVSFPTSPSPPLPFTAGTSRDLIVRYEFTGTAAIGDTFRTGFLLRNFRLIGDQSGIPLTLVAPDPFLGGLLTIAGPRTSWSHTLPPGTLPVHYRMIGVPLETGGTTVRQAVEQALGAAGVYDPRYVRVFLWRPAGQHYVEVGDPEFFEPDETRSFWIIWRRGGVMTWTGTSTIPAGVLERTVTLAPGFNMVHNPYDDRTPMSRIEVNNGSGRVSILAASNTATTPGLIDFAPASGGYVLEVGTADAGRGYWILNRTAGPVTLVWPRGPFSTKGSAAGNAVSRTAALPAFDPAPPPAPSETPTAGGGGSSGGGGGGCYLAGANFAIPWGIGGIMGILAMAGLRQIKRPVD